MVEKFPNNDSMINLLCLSEKTKAEITGPWREEYFKNYGPSTDISAYSELLLLSRTGYFSKADLEKRGMQLTDYHWVSTRLGESFYFSFEPRNLSSTAYDEFRQACAEIGYYYPKSSEGLFYVVEYILSKVYEMTRSDDDEFTKANIIGYTQPLEHRRYELADELLYSRKKSDTLSLDAVAEKVCQYIIKTTGIKKFEDILRYLGEDKTPLSPANYDVVDEIVGIILSDPSAIRLLSRRDILQKIKNMYYDYL